MTQYGLGKPALTRLLYPWLRAVQYDQELSWTVSYYF